jgi:hypothetical protein
MVLDGRICSGIGIAANSVGQHGLVLLAVFILFVEIPLGVAVEILLVPLFVAGDLGRSPGFANLQDEVELGTGVGDDYHSDDDSRLEQRRSTLVEPVPLDSGLGAVLAGMVSGRNGVESESKDRIGRRQRRSVELAAGTTNRNIVAAKINSSNLTCEMWLSEKKTWRTNSPYL